MYIQGFLLPTFQPTTALMFVLFTSVFLFVFEWQQNTRNSPVPKHHAMKA